MTELSREAILAMVPGLDLDMLVGQYVIRFEDYLKEFGKRPVVRDGRLGKNYFLLPEYSRDIAAAWEIAEKITSHTDWMLYRIGHTDESGVVEYDCTFLEVKRGVSGFARAKTAQEAIVKAALLTTLEESK